MSGDERRDQILQAALDLFSKHGFAGTTTKEIARTSGVSEALVFRHFATKDELYNAILEGKACQMRAFRSLNGDNDELSKAMAEKDDSTVFYRLALDALNAQQSDPRFMRLLIFSALEEHDLSERFFNESVSRIYDFIGEYIKLRQKDGAFREMDTAVVVRAFHGMVVHHSLNNVLWNKSRTLVDITNERAAREFSDILLHGILNNKRNNN
jgi:AcrR family transcriptional regulator